LNAFLIFALLQTLNFVLLVVNIRAIAHVQYGWAIATDGAICLLGWTLLKKITEAKGWHARAGYVCGGMVGSFLGIWITRVWG
jgi:hypothetical protein